MALNVNTIPNIINDIKSRVAVAREQPDDAKLHHSSVADMLESFGQNLENAWESFLEDHRRLAATVSKLDEEIVSLKARLAVQDVALEPIVQCDCTRLASEHGTEWGDDPQFDALYNAIWKSKFLAKDLDDGKVVGDVLRENIRLRAALRPILGVKGMGCTRGYSDCEPCIATREAQRIAGA